MNFFHELLHNNIYDFEVSHHIGVTIDSVLNRYGRIAEWFLYEFFAVSIDVLLLLWKEDYIHGGNICWTLESFMDFAFTKRCLQFHNLCYSCGLIGFFQHEKENVI